MVRILYNDYKVNETVYSRNHILRALDNTDGWAAESECSLQRK